MKGGGSKSTIMLSYFRAVGHMEIGALGYVSQSPRRIFKSNLRINRQDIQYF